MSRLSFRPRPLDIHKKLPIVKSVKDFEDYEDVPTSSTRSNSQFLRSSFSLVAVEASENDNGHQHQISIVASTPTTPSSTSLKKDKVISEIPTPQYVVVESYEQDYARTFSQPNSYLRARGGLNCLIVCFFSSYWIFAVMSYSHMGLQPGLSLGSLWSMILTMRMRIGSKNSTETEKFLPQKSMIWIFDWMKICNSCYLY